MSILSNFYPERNENIYGHLNGRLLTLSIYFLSTEVKTKANENLKLPDRKFECNTVFPWFSAPARFSAPPPPPPIRLQILISATVRVSAPPSDKRPLQISLDFDQKDGEPELFLNQLTSKSLGFFFFIQHSVKYLYAVQKIKTVSSLRNTEWLSCTLFKKPVDSVTILI